MSDSDIRRLLALVEKHIGTSWIDISEWLRTNDENTLDEIERRLIGGDFTGVISKVDAAAKTFAAATTKGYTTAGTTASDWLNAKLGSEIVHFDIGNDRAVKRAKLNQLEYVSGFRDEQNKIAQQITQQALADGQTIASNPREIAKKFRDSIGLAPNQQLALDSYRRALELGDFSNALGRQLRDARSDKLLKRLAGEEDGKLTTAQVDNLVERYRKGLIASRAENIARTESQRNVEAGVQEGFDQAVERGDINAEDLTGEWLPGPNTSTAREDHRATELLDQRPKHGEDFILPDGTAMKHPGDPRGGAKHNAGCRCTMVRSLAA